MSRDIQYQEGILEFLNEREKPDFIILSERLPGENTMHHFIKKICEIDYNIKIILILENKNEKLESYLAKYEIAIFYKNKMSLEDLIHFIKNQEEKKENISQEIKMLKEMILKNNYSTKISFIQQTNQKVTDLIKRFKIGTKNQSNPAHNKIITILGPGGIGKSIFSINLAKVFSKNHRVLIIDFDVLNSSIHTILGVKKYPENYREKVSSNHIHLENLIIPVKNGLSIISGVDILMNQKFQINQNQLKSSLKNLKEIYDFIIIDTSCECFFNYNQCLIDSSDESIFLTEANILDIKKSKRLLELYINEWKIPKEKIHILFNKYHENSIDTKILKKVFSDFPITGKLNFNKKYNLLINQNSKCNFINLKIYKEYKKIVNQFFEKRKDEKYGINFAVHK